MINRIKGLLGSARMRELLRYIFIGALTTAVNWLLYWLLTTLLGLEGYPSGSAGFRLVATVSNGIAWLLSVIFAFLSNKLYVFRSRERRRSARREFLLFVSARVMSYLLFDLLLFTLCLGFMNDKLLKLLMNVLVIVFNYFASKYLIFQRKDRA
ncbi:MAG: GtrA family protein [Christensenellales bacterium]